jgi:hypothetical protein
MVTTVLVSLEQRLPRVPSLWPQTVDFVTIVSWLRSVSLIYDDSFLLCEYRYSLWLLCRIFKKLLPLSIRRCFNFIKICMYLVLQVKFNKVKSSFFYRGREYLPFKLVLSFVVSCFCGAIRKNNRIRSLHFRWTKDQSHGSSTFSHRSKLLRCDRSKLSPNNSRPCEFQNLQGALRQNHRNIVYSYTVALGPVWCGFFWLLALAKATKST